MTRLEIKLNASSLHCHELDWNKTSRPKGFSHLKNLSQDHEPFQLGVGKVKGRIIGFFVDDIFYVVWFDPDHLLYPRK